MKRANPERNVQKSILAWIKAVLPSALVFAVPNGGRRDAITGAIMKGEGVRAGAPDLVVCHQGRIAFLEVKAPTGRLSPAQKQFRDNCAEHLIPYAVVRGIGDVEAFFQDIGVLRRQACAVDNPVNGEWVCG